MIVRLISERTWCDRAIWNLFKNGDKEAFATLYYRYSGILLRDSFRYSQDKALIQDCIHDLFLEIWTNKLNLATPISVKGYLLCSTHRKIIYQLKKRRRRQADLPQPETSQSIEEQMICEQDTRENNSAIIKVMNTLTKRQREALRFRYFDNLAYAEISVKMDISTDSVYNLVHKARNTIYEKMKKELHSNIVG